MQKSVLAAAIVAATVSMGAQALELDLTFEPLWTHRHEAQFSEIPAFDAKTNTVWVAGSVGIDVLDAKTGELVEHLDVTPYGLVNGVAIHNGLAALAVEASPDRRVAGSVLFFDTRTRALTSGVSQVTVGSLPDMLTFTADGRKLLVANEATPNAVADAPYTPALDPPGSVSIIDVARRRVVATAGFEGVPVSGDNVRLPSSTGMDFEPEYIAIGPYGEQAYVTVQEANAIGVLDIRRGVFTRLIGLGAKDFNVDGNEIDPTDNQRDPVTNARIVDFIKVPVKGLYMPDSVAAYSWLGIPLLVMANEGDYREDNADRGSTGQPFPLDRLRVSNREPPGTLFAAGARSFSIRGPNGALIYDSGSLLDREAALRGIYDDTRSRDKGVEPEGIALLDLGWKTYAFVGLERTTQSAVAVFDVTNPWSVRFLDMIVTEGALAPEGLEVYQHRGQFYLVIANETALAGETARTTAVYEIGFALSR
jgi:DNA-binding beta-propeller fold protein YncE